MNNFKYTYYMAANDYVRCYNVFRWIDANVDKEDVEWVYNEDSNLYKLELARTDLATMIVLLFGESI